jgi:hypothetical protein
MKLGGGLQSHFGERGNEEKILIILTGNLTQVVYLAHHYTDF